MATRSLLTGFSASSVSASEIARLLDQAGLELWQAPEGFWAIRVKPPGPAPEPETAPRRPRTARAA